jgi:transcription termination factor Rho
LIIKLSYSAFSIFSNVREVNLVYPIHNGSCHKQQIISKLFLTKMQVKFSIFFHHGSLNVIGDKFRFVRSKKKQISIFDMYIPCEASSETLLHQNRKLSSRISLQNRLFCLCRLPAVTWQNQRMLCCGECFHD